MLYKSEIWLFKWKLTCVESFLVKSLDDANMRMYEKNMLKPIRLIWRPFCRVKWIQVE